MAPWEMFNTKPFATEYMQSKGFQQGQGLGKHHNGITSPIKSSQTSFTTRDKLYMYVGSSMIGGVNEKKLSEKTKEKVKVYSHSGATIEDVKHHLNAHLRKKPTHLILQVGTNDAQNKQVTSDHIYDGLVELKSFAESLVPGIHVTISCPLVRSDNKWANEKLIRVEERLMEENKEFETNTMSLDRLLAKR